MCLSGSVIIVILIINAKAAIDEHGDQINSIYPSTVNFNEIFTNSLILADEPTLTTNTKDDDFHLNVPSQFVEFRPLKQETTTTPTPPPPRYILNSSYLKKNDTEDYNSTSTIEPSSSAFPVDSSNSSVKVIPIRKDYQRGVLDLLFPASRVKTFKGVFDTFRRILSHTFKRR